MNFGNSAHFTQKGAQPMWPGTCSVFHAEERVTDSRGKEGERKRYAWCCILQGVYRCAYLNRFTKLICFGAWEAYEMSSSANWPQKKLKPKSRKGFSNVNYRTILKSPNDRLIEDLSELIGSWGNHNYRHMFNVKCANLSSLFAVEYDIWVDNTMERVYRFCPSSINDFPRKT